MTLFVLDGLQVDFRQQYMIDPASVDQAEIKRVTRLDSPDEFWSSDEEQNVRNYQASIAAVAMMFRALPSHSLYALLERVRSGEELGAAFTVLEQKFDVLMYGPARNCKRQELAENSASVT